MANLSIEDYGTGYKLLIQGKDKEDIELTYNSLYNLMATSGSLYPLDESTFSYFIWTTKKKMLRYFYNLLENRYYLKTGHEGAGELFNKKLWDLAAHHLSLIPKRETVPKKARIKGDFNFRCFSDYILYD